jgi:hypothetical protein
MFRLHIHGDYCARCNRYFRFIEFLSCSYHRLSTIINDKYECCSQMVKTFDVLEMHTIDRGCQQREHVCRTENRHAEILTNLDRMSLMKAHPMCCPSSTSHAQRTSQTINKIIEQSLFGSINLDDKKGSLQVQWTSLLEMQPYKAEMKYTWDISKSARWNQDAQREDEHRRFDEMLRYLHAIQINTKSNSHRSLKETGSSYSTLPGGIYCRIENDWRCRQNTSSTNTKIRPRLNMK